MCMRKLPHEYYRLIRDTAFKQIITYSHYDPVVGRFVQKDPIGLAGGDTNLYRYVKNQPLIYTDPTGNFFLPGAIVGGVIGGLSGAAGAIIQGGTPGQIAASAAIGVFAGGWVGSGTGVLAGFLINGGANITGQVISGADSLSKINFSSAAFSGAAGASAAALGALTGTSVSGAFGGSLAASSLDILAAAVGISPNSSGTSSPAAPVGGMCGGGN